MPKKPKHQFDPCLLISMPQMQDPNFNQTVSLLSEFNSKGAVALILNRQLEIKLRDVLSPDFKKQFDLDPDISRAIRETPVYWGGPVDVQQGLILHNCTDYEDESVEIQPNLYITGSIHVLKNLLKMKFTNEPAVNFRFLLGYAGWGAHQLEQEMAGVLLDDFGYSNIHFRIQAGSDVGAGRAKFRIDISQLASVTQEEYH